MLGDAVLRYASTPHGLAVCELAQPSLARLCRRLVVQGKLERRERTVQLPAQCCGAVCGNCSFVGGGAPRTVTLVSYHAVQS